MRSHWSNRLGFILATVGSAVGLGNIWKFPYITGMNGGGAFVLVYLVAILFCGLPILMAELAIGRAAQKDVVGSFKSLDKSPIWGKLGWLNLVAAFIILSYYSVVAGWTMSYLVDSVSGTLLSLAPEQITSAFGELVTHPGKQIFYHTLFVLLCIFSVVSGVNKGLERWNRVMMPALFAIIILLFAYAMTTPGAAQGVAFMFSPDFSKLTIGGVLEAIGHSFFTLSLAMGAIITYGSYMDNKENLFGSSVRIAFLDTFVAITAGLAFFPIIFSVGLEPAMGPGMVFKTLPHAFSQIPMGQLVSILFFTLLGFAALTSAISLLEVLAAYLIDEKGISRTKATIGMGVAIWLAGVPSALSYNVLGDFTIFGMPVLDFLDYTASNIMLPLGGMLIAIFAGYRLNKEIARREIAEDTASIRIFKAWYFIIRYVSPVVVFIVLLTKVGIIKM